MGLALATNLLTFTSPLLAAGQPRSIAIAADGLARRLEQSCLGAVLVGGAHTVADFEALIAGTEFARDLGKSHVRSAAYLEMVDATDQAAAMRVIDFVRSGGQDRMPWTLWGAERALVCAEALTSRGDVRLVQQVHGYADRAIGALDLSDGAKADLSTALSKPDHVHIRLLRIPMDNGQIKTFLSYRVQHNRWLSGEDLWYGGGLRVQPDVNRFVCEMLATEMTYKNTAMGLEFGGAKGVIAADPKQLSDAEFERLLRAYARAFAYPLTRNRCKPAGDMGTTTERLPLFRWMQEELDAVVGPIAPGTFTCKPYDRSVGPVLSGIDGRLQATATGGWAALIAYETANGRVGDRIVINGFGNAAMYFAEIAHREGRRVIAVNDSGGTWHDPNGLDIPALIRQKKGQLATGETPRAYDGDRNMVWTVEGDVLVPAARHWLVTDQIADTVQTKLGLPLANNPVRPEAMERIRERERRGDFEWLSDHQVSGGGVTSSSMESEQNRRGRWITRAQNDAAIREAMAATISAAIERKRASREPITLHEAGWQVTMERLAQAKPRRRAA